jgi:pyruvate dehydrogenase E2 component (dihydrolipoamide acetyltransferase)
VSDVVMPQLGETVAEGTVTRWFKAVGETVAKGEALFEVSTDKVDTEIPAPTDGVISAILVPEGTTVDVGTRLAVIGGEGEETPTVPLAASSPAAASGPAPTRAAAPRERARGDEGPLSPVVKRLLAEHGLSAGEVTGTGPGGRVTRDDVLAHAAAAAAPATASAPLSPVVRRLLADKGLSAADVVGTGPDGRLTRRDVEAAPSQGAAAARSGDERIPFTRIRRLTAEHMVRSKATSAHTLMVREVDYENVDRVRRALGPAFKERFGYSLTYLPFNALALAEALRDYPNLNASVGDDELIVHHELHLGIAVDLENEGLVVPVVRDAGRLGLLEMAQGVRELATGARAKKLGPDSFSGGTITITNPGPFGTLITGAVINQPQVAILSTDGVARKPVVVTGPTGEESIAIHSVGLLALTFDHRAIDGAYAARFLVRMAEVIATRDWASELAL